MAQRVDCAIIGGGVTGNGDLFGLCRHSSIKRIAMIERRHTVALVNSNTVNNSQTAHDGIIETNFTLDKARDVNDASHLLHGYLKHYAPQVGMPVQKMVIGVGAGEVDFLAKRYAEFKPHFPAMNRIGPGFIGEIEPNVMRGRKKDEPITALYTPNGYAVDYHRLSVSFLEQAKAAGKELTLMFNTGVKSIVRRGRGFLIVTEDGTELEAKTVIVCAGPASLLYAHSLGYGREFGILPVTGSFYLTRDALTGKVYTCQIPEIPFAAPHGDPAVYDPHETRFGPTAMILPFLERHHYATFFEFMRSGLVGPHGIYAALKIVSSPTFARFAAQQAVYDLPYIGKRSFAKAVQKIVPELTHKDLRLDRGAGGVRGQLINLKTHSIARGADKIVGEGIIFNMAPSPGASYCLKNAQIDVALIARFLGSEAMFDKDGFRRDLLGSDEERRDQAADLARGAQ